LPQMTLRAEKQRLPVRRFYKISLGIFLFGMLAACGYHLKDRGLAAPEGVETIAVPVFENRTAETGIETLFPDALAYEITRSKVLQLVDKKRADAVLNGEIRSVRDETVSLFDNYEPAEMRVYIELRLSFMRKDGTILWADADLSDQEAYPVSADNQVTGLFRREAIVRISRRMAERIHNLILADF
jgi:outer membrane lipopolysaccharide assembly protein LptE/RlpB